MIEEDFKAAISSCLPKTDVNNNASEIDKNDSMAAETLLHRSYAAHKARFFGGREKVLVIFPLFH